MKKKKPQQLEQLSFEYTKQTIKCTGFTEEQLQDYTVNWLCSEKYKKAIPSGDKKRKDGAR